MTTATTKPQRFIRRRNAPGDISIIVTLQLL